MKWFTLQFNDPRQGAIPAGQILLIIHLAHKGKINNKTKEKYLLIQHDNDNKK